MPKHSNFLNNLKLPKGLLDYLVPAVLGVFLAYQFVVPAVARKIESSRKIASVSQPEVAKKIEVKPKQAAPPGTYYSFKANYSCFDSAKDKNIPSYVNAFSVTANQVCELGDLCNKNPKCKTALPANAILASDAASFTVNKNKFVRQNSAISDSCLLPACAAPPESCHYDEAPPLDDAGCPTGCGTISCSPKQTPPSCPALNCAALPQGCEYEGNAPLDANGCMTGCGSITCDTVNPVEVTCTNLKCAVPPENCHYDSSGKFDNMGCKTTCGKIVCDGVKKEQCPASPSCASAPAGCYYVGEPAKDENGCTIGCGGIACHKILADGCAPPKCDPAPENCRYDGNGTLNFKGCLSSCGNLICDK
jgi:hypothetical protein